VALVLDHLGTHYAEASVRRLARVVGDSPDHLSTCFREETSYYLKTYMTGLRIEAAKWPLLEAGEKIETIAVHVGLHDASHLSRLFPWPCFDRPIGVTDVTDPRGRIVLLVKGSFEIAGDGRD
jgi:transcriptional regulator GlxA family with amidase domain